MGCVFTFIESPVFARVREVYLDDDEFGELQQFMMGIRKQGRSFAVPVEYENFAGDALEWASGAACG